MKLSSCIICASIVMGLRRESTCLYKDRDVQRIVHGCGMQSFVQITNPGEKCELSRAIKIKGIKSRLPIHLSFQQLFIIISVVQSGKKDLAENMYK